MGRHDEGEEDKRQGRRDLHLMIELCSHSMQMAVYSDLVKTNSSVSEGSLPLKLLASGQASYSDNSQQASLRGHHPHIHKASTGTLRQGYTILRKCLAYTQKVRCFSELYN